MRVALVKTDVSEEHIASTFLRNVSLTAVTRVIISKKTAYQILHIPLCLHILCARNVSETSILQITLVLDGKIGRCNHIWLFQTNLIWSNVPSRPPLHWKPCHYSVCTVTRILPISGSPKWSWPIMYHVINIPHIFIRLFPKSTSLFSFRVLHRTYLWFTAWFASSSFSTLDGCTPLLSLQWDSDCPLLPGIT
jgi:hypothetical protein